MTSTENYQAIWRALVRREGSEQAARVYLAQQLRAAADQVEAGGYPDVFGCSLPSHGLLGDDFIGLVGVVLSHPWPG